MPAKRRAAIATGCVGGADCGGKMENRTARLTILIDPQKKQLFEEICAAQDLTPSQVVRRLIRQYVIDNAGSRELPDWLLPDAGKR